MNRRTAQSGLLRVKKILDKSKVRFWLNWGTLLGAIREGDFISYDTDIDLRMLSIDLNSSIATQIRNDGFECQIVSLPYASNMDIIERFRTVCNDGLHINLVVTYYYKPDNVYVAWPITEPTDIFVLTPAKFYQKECFAKFLGHQFRVPYEPIKFLEYTYGSQWKIPTKDKSKCYNPHRKSISMDKYLKWFLKHPKELRGKREN